MQPRVLGQLLEAQGDALLLLVDAPARRTGRSSPFLSTSDGWPTFLVQRHVGDVQQAVDAFLDLDERAVVGQVADLALDDRAGRVLLGHQRPGVDLGLLHAEADFLLVLVDLQDDDLDLCRRR